MSYLNIVRKDGSDHILNVDTLSDIRLFPDHTVTFVFGDRLLHFGAFSEENIEALQDFLFNPDNQETVLELEEV